MFISDWKYVRADVLDGGKVVIRHGALNYRTGQHLAIDFSPALALDHVTFARLVQLNFPTRLTLGLDRPLRPEDLLQL